jgi:Holliday junction resolvasome RuvABC endonuclease subunit
MERFVGIDYSTRKVAMVVLTGPTADGIPRLPLVVSYNAPKKLVGLDAMMEMLKAFTEWCADALVMDAEVFIESPIMGRMLNAQTAVSMGMAAGALLQASITYGASSVELVAPSYWKKQVCGNGAMAKDDIKAWMAQHRPDMDSLCDNDDERDAMCLALLAEQVSASEA